MRNTTSEFIFVVDEENSERAPCKCPKYDGSDFWNNPHRWCGADGEHVFWMQPDRDCEVSGSFYKLTKKRVRNPNYVPPVTAREKFDLALQK